MPAKQNSRQPPTAIHYAHYLENYITRNHFTETYIFYEFSQLPFIVLGANPASQQKTPQKPPNSQLVPTLNTTQMEHVRNLFDGEGIMPREVFDDFATVEETHLRVSTTDNEKPRKMFTNPLYGYGARPHTYTQRDHKNERFTPVTHG